MGAARNARPPAAGDDLMQSPRWQFWIDRGGTFTDIVGRAPDGQPRTHKLLSENPEQYSRRRGGRDPPPAGPEAPASHQPERVESVKMGTTVATNALLERKGPKTRAGDDARVSRRAAHRLPGSAALFDRHIACRSCCTSR
jgi:5-oxoprolinase (ATP-hydrolysing)